MIKLENVVLASPEQMEFIIQGMRNPMNSWEKSDSGVCLVYHVTVVMKIETTARKILILVMFSEKTTTRSCSA